MITVGRSLKPRAGRYRKYVIKKNKESFWNSIDKNWNALDRKWDE